MPDTSGQNPQLPAEKASRMRTVSSRSIAIGSVLLVLSCVFHAGCASQGGGRPDDRQDAALAKQLDSALGRGATGDAHYTARVIDLKTGKYKGRQILPPKAEA